MAEDWFRLPGWESDDRDDFERRLGRARPHNRPQYLRIKALALRNAGQRRGAAQLLERVLREYSSSLDAAYAAEVLGDIARDEGRLDDAAAWYRASLELGRSGTTGTVHISLAEVLNQEGDFDAALRALDMVRVAKLTMNSAMFRWNAALAESALGVGEQDVARAAAVRALRLLAAPDQFSRHPGVGRAEASFDQRARLETISIGRA